MDWIIDNWMILAIVICAVGLIVDVVVYMIRWQPYKVWQSFFRRLRHKEDPQEDERPAARQATGRWAYANGTEREEPMPAEENPTGGTRVMPTQSGGRTGTYLPPTGNVPQGTVRVTSQPMAPIRPTEEDRAAYQRPVAETADADERMPAEASIAQEAIQTEGARHRRSDRHKNSGHKLSQRVSQLFNDDKDENVIPPYQPGSLPVDQNDAYGTPYIPPNWKQPSDSGSNH